MKTTLSASSILPTTHLAYDSIHGELYRMSRPRSGIHQSLAMRRLRIAQRCRSYTARSLIPNAPNSAFYPNFNPILAPYDLIRGGAPYTFNGHTDVKELALYVRDKITKGNWSLNLGLRGDFYNGLSIARQAEPRLGVAYNIKKTNTILRVSYARTLESPFNENLILSSTGCENAVLSPLLLCAPGASGALSPGFRNEFHAGIEQAFGRYLVFSGEWITKYTHNGYDFSVLGNTPITFPIEWHNSKIPGYAGRVSVPNFHGFSALMVFSSVAARFFQPQIGGRGSDRSNGRRTSLPH